MSGKKGESVAKKASRKSQSPKRKTFQAFKSVAVMRSQVHFHESNPRFIDKPAMKKLRESLRKNRLVEPIIVNRRLKGNGFNETDDGRLVVVGGHQRTKAMDGLQGYPDKENSDYEIPIALVEVSPGRERTLLVSLNNPGMQGQWDQDILEQVIGEIAESDDVDISETGFDRVDLAQMLDEGVIDSLYGTAGKEQAEAEGGILAELGSIKEAGLEESRAEREADREIATGEGVTKEATAIDPDEDPEAYRKLLIERRKAYIDRQQENAEREYLLVFVAESEEELAEFMLAAGLQTSDRFLPLSQLMDKMGLADAVSEGLASRGKSSRK